MSADQPASLEACVKALERLAKDMAKALDLATKANVTATSLGNSMTSLGDSMRTVLARVDKLEQDDKTMGMKIAEVPIKVGLALEGLGVRILAIQDLLEPGGVVTAPKVAAQMRVVSRIVLQEVEQADTPAAVLFRELRQQLSQQMDPPDAEPGPAGAPPESTGG